MINLIHGLAQQLRCYLSHKSWHNSLNFIHNSNKYTNTMTHLHNLQLHQQVGIATKEIQIKVTRLIAFTALHNPK